MYFFIKNSPNPPTSALPDIVPIPAEVKTSPTLPNFPSDLEDLDLEPIKSDPSLIPNVYSPSEYANTPVNELPVKEEPSDEEMQGTWSSYWSNLKDISIIKNKWFFLLTDSAV